jgi:hypothetical protein
VDDAFAMDDPERGMINSFGRSEILWVSYENFHSGTDKNKLPTITIIINR